MEGIGSAIGGVMSGIGSAFRDMLSSIFGHLSAFFAKTSSQFSAVYDYIPQTLRSVNRPFCNSPAMAGEFCYNASQRSDQPGGQHHA